MKTQSKKDVLLRELHKLWKDRTARTILLIALVLIGNLILQEALVLILRTEYPLHTPISGSMEPTLQVGDLLIVRGGLNGNDIVAGPKPVGDIIIFMKPGNPDDRPIVHRAIRKFQEGGVWYFITKGDANAFDDWEMWRWKIPESDVIGKVIFSVPMLGYALRFLDETQIRLGTYTVTLRMVLIILLVAAFFILEYTSSSETVVEPHRTEETEAKENQRGTDH